MSESQAPEATGARRWVVPAVLVACTSTSILSTDLYTPSLPHLPRLLSSDPETVQLTMSLNLAAFAVAQLFHGPLADRYGRRRMLILGLFGFALASIGCALAQGIGGLLAARIAQGICISVPSVLVAVIVRELYSAQMAMRIMGVYGMAVGVAPAIGPLIGGYVYVYAGWRMNFVLLAVLAGVVLVLVARLLPETGGGAGAALGPRRIVADYLRLLGRPAYVRYLVPLVMLFGSLFAFVTAGPFVLIDRMGVATQHYGLYYAVLVVAYIVGGLCVIRLAGRVDPEHLVRSAIFLACLAAVLLAAPVLAGHESLYGLMAGMTCLSVAIGMILASGTVRLLDAAGDVPRGAASALVGFLQMGTASLAGLMVGTFHDGTARPMIATIAVFLCIGIIGYFGLGRRAQPADTA